MYPRKSFFFFYHLIPTWLIILFFFYAYHSRVCNNDKTFSDPDPVLSAGKERRWVEAPTWGSSEGVLEMWLFRGLLHSLRTLGRGDRWPDSDIAVTHLYGLINVLVWLLRPPLPRPLSPSTGLQDESSTLKSSLVTVTDWSDSSDVWPQLQSQKVQTPTGFQ